MQRPVVTHLATLALAILAAAGARAGDSWSILKIGDATSGRGKNTILERTEDSRRLIETTNTQSMRIKRLEAQIEIDVSGTIVEDEKGAIVRMRQEIAMARNPTIYTGVVKDDEMVITLTTTGKPQTYTIDWSEDVTGPAESNRRLIAAGFAPGTTTVLHQFDFSVGDPYKITFTFEANEEVELPSGKARLYRFHAKPSTPSVPESTVWVDETGETRRSTTEMLGSKFETLDATEKQYDEAGAMAGAEMFVQSMIESNVLLEKPRSLVEVKYAITPKTAGREIRLPEDDRQKFETIPGDPESGGDPQRVFVVRATAPKNAGKQKIGSSGGNRSAAEYLSPNALLQSGDTALIEFAKAAIGDEKNAWRASQKLEKAVHDHITKKNMGVGFASALEVLQDCEGDCSEHAVLLAACCRAVGVPSRVAMGIEYVEMNGVGQFVGHAWTEVSIDGVWYGLDATFGLGSVDPTHIRMTESSLKDGGSQSSFVGILENLGSIDLKILSSK